MKSSSPLRFFSAPPLPSLFIFFLLSAYALRTLMGEGIEPILLLGAVGAGVVNLSRGSLRHPFWIAFLLLSLYTLFVMLLPHRFTIAGEFEIAPLPYSLPAWAVSELKNPVPRIHLAPWEGARWVLRFLIGSWMILALQGKTGIVATSLDRLWLGMMILFSILILLEGLGFLLLPPFSQVNPNHKAVLILMALPSVLLFPQRGGRVVVGILFLSSILATKAVGAIILAVILLPFLLFFSLNLRTLFFILCAGVIIVGGGAWIGSLLFSSDTPVSFQARIAIFHQALRIFSDRFLFGIGFGAYPWIAPLFPVAPGITPSVRILHPENEYLWFLTEGGILAVFLLLLPTLFIPAQPAPSGKGARVSLLLLALVALWDHPLGWGGVFFSLPYYLTRGFLPNPSGSKLLEPSRLGKNLSDQLHSPHPPQGS